MSAESWLVVTVAAAFLLVGVACSPLAWVALYHRRRQSDQNVEQRWQELAAQVRALSALLGHSDFRKQARNGYGEPVQPRANGSGHPAGSGLSSEAIRADSSVTAAHAPFEPALIAVPSLPGAPYDREASVSGLSERFDAIWALADNGSSPEVIARATGQPVGQIDLILGIRRKIAGSRTTIPHAPHG
jgi:hypothetical protein